MVVLRHRDHEPVAPAPLHALIRPVHNRLPDLRAVRGWTQADLAAALDVSRQTVISLERGRYDPSLPLAFRIARVFGCRIEEVFHDGRGTPAWRDDPLVRGSGG